jgi:RND family efflux transporter MFP subunit
MKKSYYLFVLAIIAAVIFVCCGQKHETADVPKNNDAIPVKTLSLEKTSINNVIHASGQFTTNDETMLSFKTGGVISRLYVKEGDQIRKGQVLATLVMTEISAQVNQAQIAFDKASRDFKRVDNLYKDSVASLEQFQNARTAFEIAQQQLATANFNLAYSEIRATSNGVVLRKLANEGQIISPGIPILQTNSAGTSDWILRVAVSDKEWAQTNLKDLAKISIEGLSLTNVDGFVSSKSENADPLTGSFTIDIQLVNAKKLAIASGMFGKAAIQLTKQVSGWQIPYDALLDGNGNSGFVFVTNDNKTAKKIEVKIASIGKDYVLISEGLAEYSGLIVSGSAYLSDQSAIQVITK